jgi:NADH-quinone oxidoreductase subunit J
MFVEILFWVFATLLVLAAFGVILSRNPVHSALWLVYAFFNSACIWLLLEAEFLAIVLVLVYVGAVMVLFLFVVMMLDIKIELKRGQFVRYALVGALVAGIMLAEIYSVVKVRALGIPTFAAPVAHPAGYSNTQELAKVLYTDYVYPFELAAVILLVAIVAAIVLTLRRRAGIKMQDVSKQVAVRARDRLVMVKMDSVKPDHEKSAPEKSTEGKKP